MDHHSIPIIMNTRNRVTPLIQLVNWLLEANYHNIIVLDNDSTYPPLLDYYETAAHDIQVVRLHNAGYTALWDCNILVELGIDTHFAYTDADVIPGKDCPPDILAHWYAILDEYKDYRPQSPESQGQCVNKVGCGLLIDDLPAHYQWKSEVITWESQFWTRQLAPSLYDAPIDTTLALYKPHAVYSYAALRTGYPYVAQHYPWYEDSAHPTAELEYYMAHVSPTVSRSWSYNDKLPTHLMNAIDTLRESSPAS